MAKDNVQPAGKPLEPKGDQDNTGQVPGEEKGEVQAYLGSWKDRQAAEEGLVNLQDKLTTQGSELGTLRKQVQLYEKTLAKTEKGESGKQEKTETPPTGPDYTQELKAVQKQIDSLDPDEPGYQKELGKLVIQSNRIAADLATQRALTMAQAEFSKVLDERDVNAAHKSFYQENPDFNTPDMQVRIQEQMENDRTGMVDELVAYREIQRDDALARATELEEQLAEAQRLLGLKKGEEETGRVVIKGQSPHKQETKQKKMTSTELNTAALEAFQNAA